MFRKIWQGLLKLLQPFLNWFKPRSPRTPDPTEIQPLDNSGYESLFMQLLEGVDNGWNQMQLLQRLGIRRYDPWFASWLSRFGKTLQESPVPNHELVRRMVRLGELGCGELGELAQKLGTEILIRDSQPLLEKEYEPLFYVLLETASSGNQAILKWVEDVLRRSTVEQWVAWLRGYGEKLLAQKEADHDLAASMVRLSQPMRNVASLQKLAEVADEIGTQLLTKKPLGEIWEYDGPDIFSTKQP